MLETIIILVVVLVILGLVIWGIQQIEPLPGPPWIRGLLIALACIVAAVYLVERLL